MAGVCTVDVRDIPQFCIMHIAHFSASHLIFISGTVF